MKKVFILALSVLLVSFKANCQIEKGDWLVGGNAGFSSERQSGSIGKATFINFNVSANAGHFFINRLAAGLRPYYSLDKAKIQSGDFIRSHGWYIGPFVRYYFLATDTRVNFFAESSYAYGTSKYGGQTGHSNRYALLGGPVIFLNSAVGLELTFGYNVVKANTDTKDKTRTFQTGIGLQFHLANDE